MENYYSLLGINKNASSEEIKKAFREKAKQLHPDIAGKTAEGKMRALLTAYEALSNRERRLQYDRIFNRFSRTFDYPAFLRERKSDPQSQAKLLFYLLLMPSSERFDPIEIWLENGGLDFHLKKYLDREDWMDCTFLLAEELERRDLVSEAFSLMENIASEEKNDPYFRHFMEDVKIFYNKLKRRLKPKAKAS